MSPAAAFILAIAVLAFVTVAGLVLIDIAQRIRDRIRESRRKAIIAEWEENYW
jgi:hypothetical protein